MGLDISAFSKVTLVEAISLKTLQERGWDHPLHDDDNHTFLFNLECFVERSDGLVEGFYRVEGEHGFGAGSYSGYNRWRTWLSSLVGGTPDQFWTTEECGHGPRPSHFGELINFADNEGFIGPTTSAKLAKDFTAMLDKATEAAKRLEPALSDWNIARYRDWLSVFEHAAGSGVVEFN